MKQKDIHKKIRLGVMRKYLSDFESIRKADKGYEARLTKSLPILEGQREDWVSWLNNKLRLNEY